ncbi:hypothetical protein V3N99_21265 [Dermatophilaceae bacterium Soc4.6]
MLRLIKVLGSPIPGHLDLGWPLPELRCVPSPQRRVRDADLVEHAHGVGLARGLDDPGQHQLLAGPVVDDVEPEPLVNRRQDLPQ